MQGALRTPPVVGREQVGEGDAGDLRALEVAVAGDGGVAEVDVVEVGAGQADIGKARLRQHHVREQGNGRPATIDLLSPANRT